MHAAAELTLTTLHKALTPLRAGITRRGTMRPEEIAGSMRTWKLAQRPANRVALSVETRRGQGHVHDVYFVAADLHRPHFAAGDWEPGIVLVELTVVLSRRDAASTERELAAFSLHSIGRRFERGASVADRTAAPVLRDMAIAVHPDIAAGSVFEIDDADLDADPGLRGALRALVAERMLVAVEAEDAEDMQRMLH